MSGGAGHYWRPATPTILELVARASVRTQISRERLVRRSPARKAYHPVKLARWAVMLAARDYGYSYPRIAYRLGLRDHSTAIYGVGRARAIAAVNPTFAQLVQDISA